MNTEQLWEKWGHHTPLWEGREKEQKDDFLSDLTSFVREEMNKCMGEYFIKHTLIQWVREEFPELFDPPCDIADIVSIENMVQVNKFICGVEAAILSRIEEWGK